MKIRFISAAFLSALLFYWTFFAGEVIFCLIVTIGIGLALYEFFSIVKKNKPYRPFTSLGVIGGCAIVVYQSMASFIAGFQGLVSLVFALVIMMIFCGEIFRTEKQNSIANVAVTTLGIFYLAYLGSYVIRIRALEHASLLIMLLFVITKMNDVGAYFIGSRFGRRKLATYISPKKTVEGALAGLVTGIMVCMGLRYFLGEFLDFLSYTNAFFLSVYLGFFGQVGDLFESMIKRDLGIKDTGNYVPGMGGVLDVLDSMFFAVPALYFYVKSFVIM